MEPADPIPDYTYSFQTVSKSFPFAGRLFSTFRTPFVLLGLRKHRRLSRLYVDTRTS